MIHNSLFSCQLTFVILLTDVQYCTVSKSRLIVYNLILIDVSSGLKEPTVDPFREQFASNLNDICDRRGLPKSGAGRATELAHLFKMSVPSAHKWLTGGSLPELDKIPNICHILQCTADELILGLRTEMHAPELYVHVPIEMSRASNIASAMIQSECLKAYGNGPFGVLEVGSNDMEPFVMEGDFVFYDKSFASIERNGVYVIERNGRKFVRRVQLSMSGHITFLCDNALFATENLVIDCDNKGVPANCATLGMVIARILVRR